MKEFTSDEKVVIYYKEIERTLRIIQKELKTIPVITPYKIDNVEGMDGFTINMEGVDDFQKFKKMVKVISRELSKTRNDENEYMTIPVVLKYDDEYNGRILVDPFMNMRKYWERVENIQKMVIRKYVKPLWWFMFPFIPYFIFPTFENLIGSIIFIIGGAIVSIFMIVRYYRKVLRLREFIQERYEHVSDEDDFDEYLTD